MPYTFPTLEEEIARARDIWEAEVPGTDAQIWPNNAYVMTTLMGGQANDIKETIRWALRQRFATTADGDQLDEHAKDFGIYRRPPQPASGAVSVTGTAGTTIPSGALLYRSDGVEYEVDAAAVLTGNGTADITVTAVEAGANTNLTGFAKLNFATPISGVDNEALVDGEGLGGGADTETDDSLRNRLLLRKRFPPQGGAVHDYIFWALEVAGVTRVWVDPRAYGPGTVPVWFMTDDSTTNGIPDVVTLGNVSSYIKSKAPVGARPIVQAPEAAVMDIMISGIGLPSNELQQRISNELADVFRRSVQVSMPNATYQLQTNLLWQAVARATGSSTHKIEMPNDPDIPVGSIPVQGSVCYAVS